MNYFHYIWKLFLWIKKSNFNKKRLCRNPYFYWICVGSATVEIVFLSFISSFDSCNLRILSFHWICFF